MNGEVGIFWLIRSSGGDADTDDEVFERLEGVEESERWLTFVITVLVVVVVVFGTFD